MQVWLVQMDGLVNGWWTATVFQKDCGLSFSFLKKILVSLGGLFNNI